MSRQCLGMPMADMVMGFGDRSGLPTQVDDLQRELVGSEMCFRITLSNWIESRVSFRQVLNFQVGLHIWGKAFVVVESCSHDQSDQPSIFCVVGLNLTTFAKDLPHHFFLLASSVNREV